MRENFEIRIREFQKLKKGWNFGKGETFSQEHVEIAAQLASRYYKKYNVSVSGAPCEDGSIDLIFTKSDHFLDVKIPPTISEAIVKYCKGIGKNREEEMWGAVGINKLDSILEEFNEVSSATDR